MKKLFFSLFCVTAMAISANAQKGSILVYGDVGFSSSKSASEIKQTNFNISPGVGYQFTENWTAGIDFGFSSRKFTPASGPSSKSSSVSPGVFGRYTHSLGEIFSIFGQAGVNYVSDGPSGGKSNGFGANVFPAVGVNVHNGFALNFSFGGLSYNTVKAKGAENSSNSFDFSFGRQVSIGVSKNFGGK